MIWNYMWPDTILEHIYIETNNGYMHNMIVKDEQEENDVNFDCSYNGPSNDVSTFEVFNGHHETFRGYLERKTHTFQKKIHCHFQAYLVEYIWERFGCKNTENWTLF